MVEKVSEMMVILMMEVKVVGMVVVAVNAQLPYFQTLVGDHW